MRQLEVFMNDTKAGLLTEENPGYGYTFQYDEDYVASSNPPISITLPKRNEVYESELLFPFFLGNLPEGGNRKAICRLHHLDERDFFGLLIAMADKDCIGAVNVRKLKS
jgi:serine/threonine-protein kinase HipA